MSSNTRWASCENSAEVDAIVVSNVAQASGTGKDGDGGGRGKGLVSGVIGRTRLDYHVYLSIYVT